MISLQRIVCRKLVDPLLLSKEMICHGVGVPRLGEGDIVVIAVADLSLCSFLFVVL